jgi:hypothetical protein
MVEWVYSGLFKKSLCNLVITNKLNILYVLNVAAIIQAAIIYATLVCNFLF